MKTSTPDLEVSIAGIRMRNPVMVASGTFGYGREYADVVDLRKLGAVVVKGISVKPCAGNPPPRLVEVRGGLVNAIGLQNPGVEAFVLDYMPFLRKCGAPVIVNIWGTTVEEYAEVATRLDGVDGVAGIELNISCPNVKKGGHTFGSDPASVSQVVAAARKATRLPLIPKLMPNVPDVAVLARAAEDAGANALSLINTIPAMVIDIDARRPVLANRTGGLSGPAIHPVAVKLVWEAHKAVRIPIIGMGGIVEAKDAIELILAGASAVAVGSANFADPGTPLAIVGGIRAWLKAQGFRSVSEAVGAMRT